MFPAWPSSEGKRGEIWSPVLLRGLEGVASPPEVNFDPENQKNQPSWWFILERVGNIEMNVKVLNAPCEEQ